MPKAQSGPFTSEQIDAFNASNTPAAAARALGVDGKWMRGILRSRVGVYVSRGGTFDAETKGTLLALVSERVSKRSSQ